MSTSLGRNFRLWASSEIEQERLLPPGSIPDTDDSGLAQPGVALSSITAGDTVVSEESGTKLEGRQGDGWARNLATVRLSLLDFPVLMTNDGGSDRLAWW